MTLDKLPGRGMFDTLAEAARDLRPLDPLLSTTFLLEAGDAAFRVRIVDGQVASVERGPFVMPSAAFKLSAPAEDWAQFLQPVPPPGSHDLFALLRRGALRLDGDLHPFMSNLMYFKRLLASLRPEATPE